MVLGNKSYLDGKILGHKSNQICAWEDFGSSKIKQTNGAYINFSGDRSLVYAPYLYYVCNSILPQTDKKEFSHSSNIMYGEIDIVIGSGGTLPTVYDYKLEEQLTENLSSIGTARNLTINGGAITRTFRYNGDSYITIQEVGLLTRINYDYSRVVAAPVLLTRSVLATPMVIDTNNRVFTVTIQI